MMIIYEGGHQESDSTDGATTDVVSVVSMLAGEILEVAINVAVSRYLQQQQPPPPLQDGNVGGSSDNGNYPSVPETNEGTSMDGGSSYDNDENDAAVVSVPRRRAILTIIYLSVLGICFIIPIIFYCQIRCDDRRRDQELYDLEVASLALALAESTRMANGNGGDDDDDDGDNDDEDRDRDNDGGENDNERGQGGSGNQRNRAEAREVRRKYREERRARILQLFAPVRMILTEHNFLDRYNHAEADVQDAKNKPAIATVPTDADADADAVPTNSNESTCKTDKMSDDGDDNYNQDGVGDDREGKDEGEQENDKDEAENVFGNDEKKGDDDDGDDDNPAYVLVPEPGLPSVGSINSCYAMSQTETIVPTKIDAKQCSSANTKNAMPLRRAPIECSICLTEYVVGSDVVWSSNPRCFHVFHTSCIERWLMKQREGPLCPCCRNEFVIDPFDNVGEIDESTGVNNNDNNNMQYRTDTGVENSVNDSDSLTTPDSRRAINEASHSESNRTITGGENINGDVDGDIELGMTTMPSNIGDEAPSTE